MNGKCGCGFTKYGRGGGCDIYDMSKVERIMLKFRPIAPKPVAAGSGSGGSAMENSDGYVKCGRGKRKYVRGNRNKSKKDIFKSDEEKSVPESSSSGVDAVVTLSLLPETPDWISNLPDKGVADQFSGKFNFQNNERSYAPAPVWLSDNSHEKTVCYGRMGGIDPKMLNPPPPPSPVRPQVVSYVTMECVTGTWVDAKGLGCTDEERLKNMEMDTCPAFLSDGQDRVVWTNKAYRQMAGVGQLIGGEDVAVVLVKKDNWMPSPVTYPAFTCKARVLSVVHSHRANRSASSPAITLPCDAWRMDCGGYAWRLDVKAALSLGR